MKILSTRVLFLFAIFTIFPICFILQKNSNITTSTKNLSLSEIPLNQQYDFKSFTWGTVEIMGLNATNCYILKTSDTFKIYSNGSVHINVKGSGSNVLKFITFDSQEPLPIPANEYQEDIDDTNITSSTE